MAHIEKDSIVTISFTFTWQSSHATHVERYFAKDVNLIRDTLPLGVKSRIVGLGEGDCVNLVMDPSEVPPFKPGKVLNMPLPRFQPPLINGRIITPRIGRYYPKHFIESVPGTRPDSATPFRVVERDKASFKADLNHPMAGRTVSIKAEIIQIKPADINVGTLTRWPDVILDGPGMQARLPETPTDYLGDEPFLRNDEEGDAKFQTPSTVSPFDSRAITNVESLYCDLIDDDMPVLDLMAGQASHLPEGCHARVTGLGPDKKAMEANPVLAENIVHNLNENTTLPFKDDTFGAVVCTASVEYLIQPFAVFEEVARILKPKGVFILTFSDHWLEQNVIRIWTELHEFERMGLISQYFVRTDRFGELTTVSWRGWPCPEKIDGHDANKRTESDSVYAVWGRKQ